MVIIVCKINLRSIEGFSETGIYLKTMRFREKFLKFFLLIKERIDCKCPEGQRGGAF
jgi:hypothetical protein